MEENLSERITGKDFSERQRFFSKELAKIELEHKSWFEKNEDENGRDKLDNHYFMQWDKFNVSLGFFEDSNLPIEVRNKCLTSFKNIFSSKK